MSNGTPLSKIRGSGRGERGAGSQGAVSWAVGHGTGFSSARRWSDKSREGGWTWQRGGTGPGRLCQHLASLDPKGYCSLSCDFKKTQKFSHRFQNEIDKELNNTFSRMSTVS